jgi:HK97 family phage prohead protease
MKREKSTQVETFERLAQIERKADHGVTVYTASLSSEYPVERWGYTEVLEHSSKAVNFERAQNGLVLLFNHNVDEPIGRISNLKIRSGDKKLVGDLVFSKTEAGKLRQTQVDEGTLTDISIRYSVEKWSESENDNRTTRTITRWTPQEGSIVSVPADPTVGVGRNQPKSTEGETMSKENDTASKGDNTRGADGVVVEFESGRKAGLQEGARVERERVAAIDALFDAPGFVGAMYDGLRKTLIENGSTIDQAREALLKVAGGDPAQSEPISNARHADTQQRTPGVSVGTEDAEKKYEAMRIASEFKAGFLQDGQDQHAARQEQAENPFGGLTLGEMARESLHIAGIDTRGLSTFDVVGYALNPNALPASRRSFVGQGTGNFAAVVENIANKSMMQGFDEAPETWSQIVRTGQVSSFRQESRVDLSEFSDLDEVAENGEYKHGSMTDNREYIQAAKYGKLFAITREVIVNDDLNALTRIPGEMGRAANRKIGDLVYAVLTTPATLRDGTAIFDATRSNIITSGAAPSVAQVDAMRQLMALQSGMNSAAHGQNIRLSILIVPIALETTSLVLARSQNDPDQKSTESGGGGTRPNPFAGTLTVVADARLDAASSVIYYGSANPNQYDTIEVAFLNGNQSPTLESRDGWTVDGIEYKTRLECGVAPLGYKALTRNAGA